MFGALLLAMSGCVDAFPDLAPVTDARGLEDSGSMDRGMDAAQAPDRALTPDVTVDAAPDMTQPDMNSCVPAAETCNGLDDNCNGQIDEDLPRQPCDLSMGVCAGTTVACMNGRYDDCNYALADPAYEDEESRCDALDNDCDGRTDEGCACMPDETRPCGSAEGACEPGVMRCVEGVFGACEGAIEPQPEVCNTVDDDCDGQIDEIEGPCESPLLGPCRMGTRQCVAGNEVCTPIVMPVAETCNGVDDDCDGQTDNGLDDQPCDTGLEGACSGGLTRCDGNTLRCARVVAPGAQDEQCNGIDDDCDGEIDNLAVQECASDLPGVCRPGLRACDDQNEAYCAPRQTASPEICDRLDNDCDGSVDENTGGDLCQLAESACARGRTRCVGGALRCVGVGISDDDATCDGVDDDCDQKIDEDFERDRCQTDDPQCADGRLACINNRSVCVPEPNGDDDVGPDGVDQDCDGRVDEGTLVVYLEDLMMGGNGARPGVGRGPVPGYDFNTVNGSRAFAPDRSFVLFVDSVFRPARDGLTPISSTNLTYDFSGDVGTNLSWSPPAKGPDEYNERGLPPLGVAHMIELHANMGITFDLNVLAQLYRNHRMHQLRSRAGSSSFGRVKIIMLVDGEYHGDGGCIRRDGPNRPNLENLPTLEGGALREARFITFVAVDCDAGNIGSMHGLLHDARIIMRPR